MDINGALLQITLVAEEEEIRHPALAAYFAEKGADPSHIPHLISLLHGIPPSLPLSVLEATGFPESLSLVSERVQSLFTKVFPEFHINAEHFKQAFITEQLTRAIAIDEAVRRLHKTGHAKGSPPTKGPSKPYAALAPLEKGRQAPLRPSPKQGSLAMR